MKIISLLSCFIFTTANMNIIATSGISIVVFLTLMPLQSWSFPMPLDILEDDVGLLPTKVHRTTNPYASVTLAPAWEEKLKMSYKECEAVTGISKASMRQFRSGLWKSVPVMQDWALCVLNRMDLMTLQGVFRYDTAQDYIRRDVGYGSEEVKKASKLINKCLTEKLLTPGQIAWEYLRCLRKKDSKKRYPSLGILLDSDLHKKKKVVVVSYEGYYDD